MKLFFTVSNRTPSLTTSESSSDEGSIPPSPRPLPSLPHQDKISPDHPVPIALPKRRTPSLCSIFRRKRVLSVYLHYCSADDFRILTYTCRDLRHIFRLAGLKDVILGHYIPGYRSGLHSRDPQHFVDVDIKMNDLQLFLISERVGLHVYPRHALALMSIPAPPPSEKQYRITTELRELTEAHSRFVLLLQSLTHSSSSPTYEIEDFAWKSVVPSGTKELTFPAPLSYHEQGITETAAVHVHDRGRVHKRASSAADYAIGPAQPRKRKTFFRAYKSPPPPPSVDLISLRQYSKIWRRTLRCPSSWGGRDDLGRLKLPRRRFAAQSHYSDSSQSMYSPESTLRRSTPDRDRSSVSRPTSPHDFSLACSRTLAPVLRVFVPCVKFDEVSISACEEQLVDAGLWKHLSTGDIVCNLGYVPRIDGVRSETTRNEWLIFNGFGLVLFSPPDPPPVDDVLRLPSPFYYSHITPPFSNPIYVLNLAPHLTSSVGKPRFVLTSMLCKVKSPHSPGGFAMVKKYKWLASVRGPRVRVGPAWRSEWVLEGDGTTEGRDILNDLIMGREHYDGWLWEVDKEKSGQSKLWLRLLGHSSTFAEINKTNDSTDARPRTTFS